MIRVGEWRLHAAAVLEATGVEEAALKLEWLLAGVLGWPRWRVQAAAAEAVPEAALPHLSSALARLAAREPLQYVLGEADFFGRVFRCDRRALIPRPETEELVARVLALADVWARPAPAVADVGTGTGCIAITLALERPAARVVGTDVAEAALQLARENAERLGRPAGLRWQQGDLLADQPAGSLDLVVSNPPYVSAAEWAELAPELRAFEPRRALVAGPGGLEVLACLAEQAFRALRPGGRLACEMGSTQGIALAAHLRQLGFSDVVVHNDLAGLPRMVFGVRV